MASSSCSSDESEPIKYLAELISPNSSSSSDEEEVESVNKQHTAATEGSETEESDDGEEVSGDGSGHKAISEKKTNEEEEANAEESESEEEAVNDIANKGNLTESEEEAVNDIVDKGNLTESEEECKSEEDNDMGGDDNELVGKDNLLQQNGGSEVGSESDESGDKESGANNSYDEEVQNDKEDSIGGEELNGEYNGGENGEENEGVNVNADDTREKVLRKPFGRVWDDNNEIKLLETLVELRFEENPLKQLEKFQHHLDKPFTQSQISDKFRRLKKKFLNNQGKSKNGRDPVINKEHEKKLYLLSKKIWGDEIAEGADVVERRTARVESSMSYVEWDMTDAGTNKEILKRGFDMIENSKRMEIEGRWKRLRMDELQLAVRRASLINEQMKLSLDAYVASLL